MIRLAVRVAREHAELVLAETKSQSQLVHEPLPADDPVRRRPDLTLARERLDYAPRVELAQGIAKTVAYFRGITPRE